jgi:SAM-dependent methyltransferase
MAVAQRDDLATVDWDRYDFIDLGCSTGGSLQFCVKRFSARRGVGIDLDPRKVGRTREAGYDVLLADAADLGVANVVRFVSMLDFLEHLPDRETAKKIISQAARAATDFIFIRHPSFDGEEFATERGVRQYWWNWRGHPNHLQVSDYCQIFDELALHQYVVKFEGPVFDSEHPSILCNSEPPDQHEFDASIHAPRPVFSFPRPLWRRQTILIALRAFEPSEWDAVVAAASN